LPIIYIDITGKNLRLKNFLVGEWMSRWTIGDGKIIGNITAKAHYFEEGNIQFHYSKNFTEEFELTGENIEDEATFIVEQIQ